MNEPKTVKKPALNHQSSAIEACEAKVVCGAKNRSGKPCQRPPAAGKRRCRLHGGARGVGAPTGPGNGNWKDGRYSRVMDRKQKQAAWRAYWKRKREEWAAERANPALDGLKTADELGAWEFFD